MNKDESMLLSLLSEEVSEMERLRALLEAEAEALQGLQADALLQMVETKAGLVQALERLGARRAELLVRIGCASDPPSLKLFMANAPAPIATAWQALVAETGRCESLNRRNGALNQSGQRQVLRLIRVLRGEPVEPPTYGRKGDPGVGGGQPLAKA
ncbi:flagella synthesis protein FlgN [Acidihalobacter prosperus]|uniref:Flagellar biosynthesis protein FlgN n=1 Tax=Acidihalobacter prosperus TaxID=160660 RepID=A0A1A6C5D8_9GAMM|nr:flagellar protein FlgN [Acidihalobacter prosperus]OBS09786.1 hypothetical protein Thpro_020836 [Acidihalobacter prosperus]